MLAQKPQSGIVYCNSRSEVERQLKLYEIKARRLRHIMREWKLHYERSSKDFQQIMFKFRKLVTIAFGMGINKSNVRLSLTLICPSSLGIILPRDRSCGRDDDGRSGAFVHEPLIISDRDFA